MKRKIWYGWLAAVLTIVLALFLAPIQVNAACSSLAAGTSATQDDSVLFGHNEDDSKCPTLMRVVPRIHHEPGEAPIVSWDTGSTIPQVVGYTWAYIWSYMPGFSYSDSYLNEWGVSIASNSCSSSRETQPYDLTDGGIGYWLRRLVAERAKTAREGVKIMGEAVEYYGYAASGRTYTVADPKEAWLFAAVAGKRWVAQRVPDHHVAFIPNYYTIRQVNLKDKRNFLACPDLISYAITKGWYDPATGPFDFAKVYNTPGTQASLGNKLRHWGALRLLTGIEYPNMDDLPFSVKPNRKLTVQDIIQVLRCHYEDTEWAWDPAGVYTHPHSYRIDGTSIRTICTSSTQESFVMQLRSYMPSFVGNVYWRAQCRPCESVFVPWYSGILEVPKPYDVGKSTRSSAPPEYYDPNADDDMSSAYWAFDKMTDLVNVDYAGRIGVVRDLWDEYEAAAFDLQDEVEKAALDIYYGKKRSKWHSWHMWCNRVKDHHEGWDENEYLARWFLTRYTESGALNAYFKTLDFIKQFEGP
jgi:dipeptidase